MPIKKLVLTLFAIIMFSCKTTKRYDYSLCRSYKVTDDRQISWSENAIESFPNKTFTELRFCTHHPSVLGEVIYEAYGKWDSIIRKPQNKIPILLWNDLQLDGIDKQVSVGTTSYNDVYSTILIFDKDGNDLLSETSEYKVYLVNFLTNTINSYNVPKSKSNYSMESWKEINPESFKKHHPNSN